MASYEQIPSEPAVQPGLSENSPANNHHSNRGSYGAFPSNVDGSTSSTGTGPDSTRSAQAQSQFEHLEHDAGQFASQGIALASEKLIQLQEYAKKGHW